MSLSDLQILQIIKDSYQISQNAAVKFYADWLKLACDVFTTSFYEIKDTVLAIALTQCLQMKCINFCTDDKRARRRLLSFSVNESFYINSISHMGFYWVAKQKKLLNKEEATDYLSGLKKNCKPFETIVSTKNT